MLGYYHSCCTFLVFLSVVLCPPRYFARRAEMDSALGRAICNSLRYRSAAPAADSPSAAIAEKLLLYEDLLERLIEEDRDIQRHDNNVFLNGYVSSLHFSFSSMRSHLLEVFSRFFSYNRIINCML